ncbi:MAG TPA: TlpA disulfide reductase family protein [Bryobacteraceae bacterium]|nr:TlpA disulfide reductase family protein [Bryobacteraceae bacterium]
MLLPLLFLCLLSLASGQSIEGRWYAAVALPTGDKAFFVLALERQGGGWQGTFVNGPDRNISSSGRVDGRKLRLEFNYWDGVLEAELKGGKLEGAFTRQYRKETRIRPFVAQRTPLTKATAAPGASVEGEWIFNVERKDGKEFWLAAFRQNNNKIEGTLIPVSGDYGTLTGWIENRTLLLSRFDGIRATVLKARVNPDGSTEGTIDADRFRGRRPNGFGQLPDATTYTRMKNPREPFRFSFPDLHGGKVSSADERFAGKVVIVTITGSWCPNCHEEAPLLAELYESYRNRGLEIVALGFEYTGERERDLRQLRLFAEKHKIKYPVLLAGTTENATEMLGQLENFRAYPTTLFIGRDGVVRRIHAGFDGPATGERHIRLKKEMTEFVEKLLAEK